MQFQKSENNDCRSIANMASDAFARTATQRPQQLLQRPRIVAGRTEVYQIEADFKAKVESEFNKMIENVAHQ